MDQAVYEPVTQKIFGVRGQWLFKFNSLTGSLEGALKFVNTCSGTSTIATTGGFLYIGVSWEPTINWSSPPICPDVDMYVVNAAAFVVSSRLNLFSKIGPTSEGVHFGWRTIVPGGNGLVGYVDDMATRKLFNVDPLNTAGFTDVSHQGITDVAWDGVNGVIWTTTSFDPNIVCFDPNFASFNTCSDTNGNLNTICGICYNNATNKVYAVDGTFAFYSFNAALAMPGFFNFHVDTFNSGRINANPFKIKSVNGLASNPLNGKILMPCWADDTVLVIDPGTDTVSAIKTGFTAPFDIVSTPTKNWAVQTGATGLKEIV
jgi:hypothetical protein